MSSCTVTPVQRDSVLTIRVRGSFNFGAQRQFRDAYEGASGETRHIVVDVEGVEHVDSSALGMLVLLKKKADETQTPVSIMNCNDHLRRLFQIAHLDSVFRIS